MNKARELGEALAETVEFKAFIAARDIVDDDVDTTSLLIRYQQQSVAWQEAMQGNDTLQAAKIKGELETLAKQIEARPAMVDFQQKQGNFQMLMDQVNGVLGQFINPEAGGCSDGNCSGGCDGCHE